MGQSRVRRGARNQGLVPGKTGANSGGRGIARRIDGSRAGKSGTKGKILRDVRKKGVDAETLSKKNSAERSKVGDFFWEGSCRKINIKVVGKKKMHFKHAGMATCFKRQTQNAKG